MGVSLKARKTYSTRTERLASLNCKRVHEREWYKESPHILCTTHVHTYIYIQAYVSVRRGNFIAKTCTRWQRHIYERRRQGSIVGEQTIQRSYEARKKDQKRKRKGSRPAALPACARFCHVATNTHSSPTRCHSNDLRTRLLLLDMKMILTHTYIHTFLYKFGHMHL